MRRFGPAFALLLTFGVLVESFRPAIGWSRIQTSTLRRLDSPFRPLTCLAMSEGDADEPRLKRVPPDMEGVPIPYIDVKGNSFIECYADSVAYVNGEEYTIGVPCDYSVALCYFDDDGQLIPVELDDDLMDDIFPLAEMIVAEGMSNQVLRGGVQTKVLTRLLSSL